MVSVIYNTDTIQLCYRSNTEAIVVVQLSYKAVVNLVKGKVLDKFISAGAEKGTLTKIKRLTHFTIAEMYLLIDGSKKGQIFHL